MNELLINLEVRGFYNNKERITARPFPTMDDALRFIDEKQREHPRYKFKIY